MAIIGVGEFKRILHGHVQLLETVSIVKAAISCIGVITNKIYLP